MQTGRLRGAKLQRYVAADCWRGVHAPERSISALRAAKSARRRVVLYLGSGYEICADVFVAMHVSVVPGRLAVLRRAGSLRCGTTDAAPRGRRELTQNRSYTPYASAQKRTPSSNEKKTGTRWRPPRNTLASVSSRFLRIYVSFDHLS